MACRMILLKYQRKRRIPPYVILDYISSSCFFAALISKGIEGSSNGRNL